MRIRAVTLGRCLVVFFAVSIAALGVSTRVAEAKKLKQEDRSNPVVLLKTNLGSIYLELFPKEAPKTVANFVGLAHGTKEFMDAKTTKPTKRPYYDGLIFHRVIKGFMVQGGCPLGTGTGRPGYQFEDEINADALGLNKIKALDAQGRPNKYLMIRDEKDFYAQVVTPLMKSMGITTKEQARPRLKEVDVRIRALSLKDVYANQGYRYSTTLKSRPLTRGVLAMANSGPNSNGSQFFINLVDTPWLNGKHTVFGKVIQGLDVLDRIGAVPVAAGGRPKRDVKILALRLHGANAKRWLKRLGGAKKRGK